MAESGFWKTANVKNKEGKFFNCVPLKKVALQNFDISQLDYEEHDYRKIPSKCPHALFGRFEMCPSDRASFFSFSVLWISVLYLYFAHVFMLRYLSRSRK